MPPRQVGRGADQFPLRLPPGLRDRIKDDAEIRGTSMNTLIVRALEEKYPEPMALDLRLEELVLLLRGFRAARGHEGALDALSTEVRETMEAMASGRVASISETDQRKISRVLARLQASRDAERRRQLDRRVTTLEEET